VVGPAEALDEGPLVGEARRRGPHESVTARDVDGVQFPTGAPARDPRGPPHQRGPLGPAREGHDDPFAGGPRRLDPLLGPVAFQPLVDPVGQPEQRELAQRGEVPRAEVVRPRRVDPGRGVDVAVRERAGPRRAGSRAAGSP
jgi:hypothetical protein